MVPMVRDGSPVVDFAGFELGMLTIVGMGRVLFRLIQCTRNLKGEKSEL
jgi:hypothetical protein